MVVFGSNYGAGYGHVAWVIEATLDYIIVYEQNWPAVAGRRNRTTRLWLGKSYKTPTRLRFPMWFIRPNFKSEIAPRSVQSPTQALKRNSNSTT